jgi:hypothetical protein
MARRSLSIAIGAALFGGAWVALPTSAQTPTDSTATSAPADTTVVPVPTGTPTPTPAPAVAGTPAVTSVSLSKTMLRGGQMGELLSVYVPRQESEISRLAGDARAMQRSAESEIDEARNLATEADGRVRITSEEIETTKTRRDVARKAKDEAARAELEATLKRQSSEKAYLERLRDALRADADRLEADREASQARVKALDLELEVARSYVQVGSPSATPEMVTQYRQSLQRMLDAQKNSAEHWKDASEKRRQVADRRLKQLQSLSKLSK